MGLAWDFHLHPHRTSTHVSAQGPATIPGASQPGRLVGRYRLHFGCIFGSILRNRRVCDEVRHRHSATVWPTGQPNLTGEWSARRYINGEGQGCTEKEAEHFLRRPHTAGNRETGTNPISSLDGEIVCSICQEGATGRFPFARNRMR